MQITGFVRLCKYRARQINKIRQIRDGDDAACGSCVTAILAGSQKLCSLKTERRKYLFRLERNISLICVHTTENMMAGKCTRLRDAHDFHS